MSLSPSTFEIDLEKLTYGGDALGRLEDGRAVFVPFGLPGERVRVRIVEEKRGHVRAELMEVLQASPDRISPKCAHFGICGGCHYQHMSYESQLKAKTEILRDQLTRIGKIERPPVRPAVASYAPWNYRNHIQFHLTKDGKLGYVNHKADGIFAVSECHLPETSIDELWPQLDFDSESEIQRVSIRSGDELMLILESQNAEPPELEVEADLSVVHVCDEHPIVLAGKDHFLMRVLERSFRVSAASFFQVNIAVTEKMIGYLLDRLPASTETILDLYCGVGLFSAFFAPRCKRLAGIESSPSACDDFAVNLDEFDHVELYEGLVEDILPHLDLDPELVLLDPPRAGLERRAIEALILKQPRQLAYVSCDPSTLARDAKRLIEGGYRLVEATPFDLFPQTYHIESISLFER